jgi:hypothetical protein
MDVTVRVMSCGVEIDRITRPLRTEGNQPAVAYRKSLWPIENGCIYISGADVEDLDREFHTEEWATLVHCMLPATLPTQKNACSDLLNQCFRGRLPLGVLNALCSLTSLGLELEARDLLVDFLQEMKSSSSLNWLLRKQLLESEKTLFEPSADHAKTADTVKQDMAMEQHLENEEENDWDWESEDEMLAPRIEDQHLREAANRTQQAIGNYRPTEDGQWVPELAESFEDSVWGHNQLIVEHPNGSSRGENTLMERTAQLGEIALDVLRYFVDNPGDRSVHAELVLGYPASDINKLLSGSLKHYLKRNPSGGWDCYPWVGNLLSALDETS